MLSVIIMLNKRVSCPVRYSPLENHVTEQIVGSTDQQPLLETPGEVPFHYFSLIAVRYFDFMTHKYVFFFSLANNKYKYTFYS